VKILVNGKTYREMGLEMNLLETDDLVSRESIPGIDIYANHDPGCDHVDQSGLPSRPSC
jgi:hypothetical protein